jgi:signal transduction histidine kinase
LWTLVACLLLTTVAAGYFFSSAVDRVRIGSERYDRIIAVKDLQSEVSVPSLQLAKTQLEVQELVLSSDEVKPSDLAGLARLQRGYKQRYEAWATQLAEFADPELQGALDVSYDAAGAYFEALEGPFLSAARAGDRPGMQEAATGPLAQQYALHQATAEKVSVLAQDQLNSVERAAAAELVSDRRLMLAAGLGLGLLAVALTLLTLRSTTSRLRRMRHFADKEFPRLVSRAEVVSAHGGRAQPQIQPPAGPNVLGNDELARTERAFHRVVDTALDLAGEAAHLRHTTADLLAYTGRLNHQLLSEGLTRLSALESLDVGPEPRSDLAELRTTLTRMRRHAEGMLAVAGVASTRRWHEPVLPALSLQAALVEIDGAARVDWELDDSVAITGPAGADLAQVLAELLDNATRFSPPDSTVSVRGLRDGDDYLIVISNHGLGMPETDVAAVNELLANSEMDLHDSRRMGLSVVARLADRHDLQIVLENAPAGGLVVRVRVPAACLRQVLADPAPVESPAAQSQPAQSQPAQSQPAQSMTGSPVVQQAPAALAVLPVVPDVEPVALPRRIRGASLDPSLFEVPAHAGAPDRRSPQEVRAALTALAAGRAAAADRHPDHPGLIP